jgi:hypothetical protein
LRVIGVGGTAAPSRLRCFTALSPAPEPTVFYIVGHPGQISPVLTRDHSRTGQLRVFCSIYAAGMGAVPARSLV